MQQRKWYSPTRHIVRLCRYTVTRFRNPIIFILSAILYAIFDIYGLRGAPQQIIWLITSIKKQQMEMRKWQRKNAK